MQKKTLILSIILTGISAGVLAGLFMDILIEPLTLSEISTFLFSIPVNMVLLILFALPILVYLRNITRSLTYLGEGKPADPIQRLPIGLFADLTEAVNRIIANQQEFQMARGRLYEQISEVAAQEERKRLARDLHDSIKQQVFSISISAAAAHAHLENNPTAAREALIDVKQSAQEAMVEMRALLQQLSPAPVEKSGLIEALREQCEALGYRTGAHVQTHFGTLPSDDRLPTGTQALIFRIAQEALSNIARHARAQHVDLKLYVKDDQQVVLEIYDDGQGFNTAVPSTGMGLSNMRSRAESIHADFELTSSPVDGTRLTITIPLVKSPREETMIFVQLETQRKAAVKQYWWFAGTASVTIAAIGLLLWRMINRSQNFFADTFVLVLLVILVAAVIIGLPMLVIVGRRAYQQTQRVLIASQYDRHTIMWLGRHRHMMNLIIAMMAAMFVPLVSINSTLSSLIPVGVGLLFIVVGIWHYFRMYTLYRDEVSTMPAAARIDELEKRLGELRSSWVSLFILLVIQLITLSLGDALRFPPQNADNWITFIMASITIGLFANQIISMSIYRNWRDEAAQELAAAQEKTAAQERASL